MIRCSCGGSLVREASADGLVVTLAGVSVQFRRHSDFVVCPSCLRLYAADELQQGHRSPARLVARKILREPAGTAG